MKKLLLISLCLALPALSHAQWLKKLPERWAKKVVSAQSKEAASVLHRREVRAVTAALEKNLQTAAAQSAAVRLAEQNTAFALEKLPPSEREIYFGEMVHYYQDLLSLKRFFTPKTFEALIAKFPKWEFIPPGPTVGHKAVRKNARIYVKLLDFRRERKTWLSEDDKTALSALQRLQRKRFANSIALLPPSEQSVTGYFRVGFERSVPASLPNEAYLALRAEMETEGASLLSNERLEPQTLLLLDDANYVAKLAAGLMQDGNLPAVEALYRALNAASVTPAALGASVPEMDRRFFRGWKDRMEKRLAAQP